MKTTTLAEELYGEVSSISSEGFGLPTTLGDITRTRGIFDDYIFRFVDGSVADLSVDPDVDCGPGLWGLTREQAFLAAQQGRTAINGSIVLDPSANNADQRSFPASEEDMIKARALLGAVKQAIEYT